MTPDQKMFVLNFVKQLHSCIEKRGAVNQTPNGVESIRDNKGSYSCRIEKSNEHLRGNLRNLDVKDC